MRLHSSIPTFIAGLLTVVLVSACTGQGSPSTPAPARATPSPTPSTTESPELTESPSPSARPSPTPTDDDRASATDWTEAARFDAGEGLLLASDVSAWSGGFIAIGHEWTDGYVGGPGGPRIWTSDDGRAWEEASLNLGPDTVELRGILRLSAGGVIVIGEQYGSDGPRARAFRSEDGTSWTEIDLPTEIAERGGVRVASGPVGHLITLDDEIWYSAEAESWQLVHEAPTGVTFLQPAAGDEGFVTSASSADGDVPVIYASGDGLTWYEGTTPTGVFGVAPWRGDWFGWGYTEDPASIGLFRSANGLDWSDAGDLSDLTGPGGPTAGQGMDSDVTEMTLSGEGSILLATLGWNHCCATPPRGVATYLTTDAETWAPAGLPEGAYVSALATDGTVVVAAGHLERGASIGLWVADR